MRDFLLRPLCAADGSGVGSLLAGGPIRFHAMETLAMGRAPRHLPLKSVDPETLRMLSESRAPILGVPMDRPRIMAVLNVTPDSFSDGRPYETAEAAIERGLQLAGEGADFIDIGGELTRPGAKPVDPSQEQDRVLPVIEGLIKAGLKTPISIDTRNSGTARHAYKAGARMMNDISALTHDTESLATVAELGYALCLMHTQGEPGTMQDAPAYRNVLIEVYDWLEQRVAACVSAGVPREKIVVDPGIGFGKTRGHNLALIGGLAAFHGLGCPVMLGASRKAFIGGLSGETNPEKRVSGSIAAGIVGAGQGAQILRVHDVVETRQALTVWRATSAFCGE